jgi:hypothetical protein
MAPGQGHWGRGNCNSNGAMGDRMVLLYVLFRGSMSCIVVVENVQNVWTAIICEVVPANKTGMMWSGILFGVSE